MKRRIRASCLMMCFCIMLESVLFSSATDAPLSEKKEAIVKTSEVFTIKTDSLNKIAAQELDTAADINIKSAENTKTSVGYNKVPLYFQTDYPDTPYGRGTVASSGCSVTCLAMVASYLADKEYLPDDLAGRSVGAPENYIERMKSISNSLDIPPYEDVKDFNDAVAALADGKVVIAVVGEASIFTGSQHLIVLTGMSDDGKIFVNDPYGPNYDSTELAEGYKNGFHKEVISTGFGGGFAYKKAAKTEEPKEITPPAEEEAAPAEPVKDTDSKKRSYDTVPLYFQTDYPNTLYGTGTIASSGCSVTSVAMVASYLTQHEYLPDEIADYIADYTALSHIDRLEYASDLLRLPWSRSKNFHYSLKALQEGKIVIALMNEKSLFTTGQHFIVLYGINKDGKIMVHDSNEANYSVWNLENAFINGFSEDDILCGYEGGWIYDPSVMQKNPFIYSVDKPDIECRYPDVVLNQSDRQLLARMIWVEARGESFEGQQAIAEIVLNRLVSGNYQDSIAGIVYAKDQFNSTPYLDDAEPTYTQFKAIERALKGPYVLPMDVVYFGRGAANTRIWGQIGGHVFCYR